jgi:xylan 1,4-beta-xylosidase
MMTGDERRFLNPILPGFYPDPSVCRKGDDFYLVNSTFSYYPGIPVFHSRDLVNWRQLGHVMDRPAQLNLDGLRLSDGIYAPAIHYHKGTFYVTCTLVRNGGNFIVTAEDPAGPWSDPVWVEKAGGIDPSLFFDDDGKAYWVGNGDPVSARYDGHKVIWMQEFDLQTMDLVPDTYVVLVDSGSNPSKNPIWIEGPHMYKAGDYYYLMAAEDGTFENHTEVIFRSRKITGPFESYSGNPILTQRHLDPGRKNPITSTGHADLIDTPGGEWWAFFLGCRPYEPQEENHYNTGRETFLAPVRWVDDWPVINPDFEEVQYSYKVPDLPYHPWKDAIPHGNFTICEEFSSDTLAPYWMFLRTPREKWYSLKEKKGSVRLSLRPDRITGLENPSFIGRRQQHSHCTVQTALVFSPRADHDTAGIIAFQNETHFYYMGMTLSGGKEILYLEKGNGMKIDTFTGNFENKSVLVKEIELGIRDNADPLFLKITVEGKYISFYYSLDPHNWKILKEDCDNTLLSTRTAGWFVGVMFGMYASSQGKSCEDHYADFEWFEYQGNDPVY